MTAVSPLNWPYLALLHGRIVMPSSIERLGNTVTGSGKLTQVADRI